MSKKPQSCRSCLFYDVKPSDRVSKHNVRRCNYEVPADAWPPIPNSMSKYYRFSWPKEKSFIGPNDGGNCPVYAPQVKP